MWAKPQPPTRMTNHRPSYSYTPIQLPILKAILNNLMAFIEVKITANPSKPLYLIFGKNKREIRFILSVGATVHPGFNR